MVKNKLFFKDLFLGLFLGGLSNQAKESIAGGNDSVERL